MYLDYPSLTEEQRVAVAEAIAADNSAFLQKDGFKTSNPNSFYRSHGKRVLSIAISGVALVVTVPLNLIMLVATAVDVGRPLLFSQTRIGLNGKPFRLTKFRNMTNETDEHGELLLPELRVTKWGKFARKTSLDELLNLWSVFKGDMAIIGPRPLPVKYASRFSAKHQHRHDVRPGLECPVRPEGDTGDSWGDRLENDVWYAANLSFAVDVKMFGLLVKEVFSPSKRAKSASGSVGEFMGYDSSGHSIDSSRIPLKYQSLFDDAESVRHE